MSEETTAPEAVELHAWLGEIRLLKPVGFRHEEALDFRVYWNGDESFNVTFGTVGSGLSSSVWTDAAALKVVIEECQRALAVKRGRS
jgi:hypothetical protein